MRFRTQPSLSERLRSGLNSVFLLLNVSLVALGAGEDQDGNDRAIAKVAALVSRGQGHFKSGDHDQAIDDYTEAIRLDPGCARAFAGRARAWAKKHYRERETADLTEAIRLDSTNASYRVSRADSWSAQGMHKQAIADYDEAIRMEPGDPAKYVARGNEWRKHLKLDQAIADFDRALQLDPKHVPAYLGRGNTWKQSREFDKAIKEFSELIRLDPENALGHQSLARILATCHDANYRNGNWAVDEAKRACELTRWHDPDCLDTLAASYAEAGDFQAAVKWQTEAIGLLKKRAPSALERAMDFGGRKGVGFADRLAFYQSKKPARE